MKKSVISSILTVIVILTLVAVLGGCEPQTLQYKGEERSLEYISDDLENILQKENPDNDIDVDISVDMED
ncbi:hypothetical protein 031MP004_58 [Bacillus phage 031MP004]|nr:hypothetical protein 022DV001_57 [Bacillus phage 022DV001]QFG05460.1 hypothetical protein 031MP003_60 [Bacillus phage 031MP003]QFG05549.1 hypothetical protein 031MP002_59 [Bacillus phage 031MP002]QFG05635.1 hypothetical protein 031MP004_58 [Bacillus phage 031MP004]QFG05724.1 hypothetical protein 035JT001_57 [Bacillus phage 035JT001]QFG05807.1 hypothetical protein 055SW001_57 [Bacillus phage 055SW001]